MKKIIKSLENNKYNFFEVVVMMFMTLLFGIFVSIIVARIYFGNSNKLSGPLKDFYNTYRQLKDTYYANIDETKLLDAGINGMIDYIGDPYTTFMDEEEAVAFNQQVEGYYIGFGISIIKSDDEKISIQEIYDDGSAKKVGLKVNDVIVKVENKDVTNLTTSELSTKLKGEQGTKSKITVLRKGKELEYTLTRGKVAINSVSSKVLTKNNKKVGYIKVDIFAANTGEQFAKELKNVEKQKVDSIIIDVRDNQGGYLSVVKDIISSFIGKNKVIYQLTTKDQTEKIYSSSKEPKKIPVVVLINEASASASEVLATAFQDIYSKAYIIGKTSYGKGTVQKTYNLSDGSMIKYTVQKWLTSKGKSIDKVGVKPDIEVDFDYDNYYTNPVIDNDAQLQKALEVLTTNKAE